MNDPTQAQFNGALPPEYQEQLDNYKRKQLIAARLMTQNQLQMPVQGAVASKVNPWAALASVGGQGAAQFMDQDAQAGARQVQKKYAEDEAADLAALQNTAPDLQVQTGRNSKFTRSRQLAESLNTQQQKLRETRAGIYKDAGQTGQAINAAEGRDPGPEKPREMPIFGEDPSKNPYALTYNHKGEAKLGYAPKGVNIANNIDLKEEAKMVAGEVGSNLKERRVGAKNAQSVIGSVNFAVDALENGAKVGGGEDWKQSVRKGLQAFGVNLPETASAEQLQMALFQNVLANTEKIRPASDTDIQILQKMGGSIGSDPQALTKALAFAHSIALKDLHGYHEYAKANENNLNPALRPLFVGATSGYEMPTRVQGPIAFQVEALRQAQRNGMDVSKFMLHDGDKSSPFGENAKASKFDPTVGFKGINDGKGQSAAVGGVPSPSSKATVKTYDQLTPEQREEADAIKEFLRQRAESKGK